MATTVTTIAQQAVMQTVDRAAQRQPADAARIARAGQLLLAGAVRQVTPTLWMVTSQRNASVSYPVMADKCACEDFKWRRRDGYECVHMLAASLHGIAQERAAVLAARMAAQWAPEEQKRLEFARHLLETQRIGEGE